MAPSESGEAARRREHERLALLAEFGREALQHAALMPLLHRACDLVARAMSVERSKVLRYRPESADLLVISGIGWDDGVVGHAVLGTDVGSPPGRALQTATSVAIEDLTKNDQYHHSQLLRDHGVRALINVPIIVDGLNWGVFEVDSREVRKFTPADESFLLVFAHLIGAAILRTRAIEAERKSAERRASDEKRRDLLLRELHHRVRNNFQIIVSMLLGQSIRMADESARRAFRDIADRTIAIALAHEQLSITQSLDTVDMERYLTALVGRIVPERPEIAVDLELRGFQVAVDQAVVAGLFVNEAITNALKHAFPGGTAGLIRLQCTPIDGDTRGCISVTDNGLGEAQPREGHSGMALIEALCTQLGGELEFDSRKGKGTTIVVRFPLTR